MKSKALFLAVFAVFFSGCGTGKTELEENLTVENVTPSGSVGGVVYDAVTEAPVAGGVDVTVIAGGEEPATTTTDANGFFMVSEIPASGDVIILLQTGGYLPAVLTRSFVNAAGNFPLGNAVLSIGPIGMVPANQSMTVRLFSESGDPVPGVSITASTFVRYMDMTDGWAMPVGTSTVDATSDSAGKAVFSGLPDYIGLGALVDDTIMVKVPPIDYSGDGVFDYRGGTFFLVFGNTINPERILHLQNSYPAQLQIEYSNIDELENPNAGPSLVPYNGPIHVLFNLPVKGGDDIYVKLVNEFDTETMGTKTSVDGKYLSITFDEPLDPGSKYHLRIHAVSAVGDGLLQRDFYAPIYTAPNEPLEVVGIVRDTSISTDMPDFVVHFNQPIGTGNHMRNGNFHSANCVLWFDANLAGGTVGVGNDPGEWGHESCNIGAAFAFRSDEKSVSMPGAYESGYSTRWRFTAPQVGLDQTMPQGTRFYIIFSAITNQAYVVTTPGGEVVRDFMALLIP